jgi:hypothetical protein
MHKFIPEERSESSNNLSDEEHGFTFGQVRQFGLLLALGDFAFLANVLL